MGTPWPEIHDKMSMEFQEKPVDSWGIRPPPSEDFVPEGESLPCERGGACYFAMGVLFLLLSLASLAYAVFLVVRESQGGSDGDTDLVIALGLGVLLVVFGLKGLRYRDEWTLTATSVARRWRGLGGWKSWTEPLSNYAGVLMHDVRRPGSEGYPPKLDYVLDLYHPDDRKKTLRLWHSHSQEKHSAECGRYARLLGLPALVATENGFEQREIDDLGKSVRERVAVGAIEATLSTSPPGNTLNVRVEEGALLITTRKHITGGGAKESFLISGVAGMVFSMLGGMLVFGFGFGVLAFFVFVMLLPSLGAFLIGRMFRPCLEVSAAGVRTWSAHPWGRLSVKVLPSPQIDEVVVRTPTGGHGFKAVLVTAGEDSVWWGGGLSQEELEWVRDCIVAVISA
jgi:hypothetical protein